MIFSGHYYQEDIQKCPEKIAKSFDFINLLIYSMLLAEVKRRNLAAEMLFIP